MSHWVDKGLTGRNRRKVRVRKKVFGTNERPRLNIFRSAKHMYVQIIDDTLGKTLVSASTLDKSLQDGSAKKKTESARAIGELTAKRCNESGINKVVFDRNGFKYHGRIKAVAEAARKAGLTF